MNTKRFKIDKLIRDSLPEIMRSSGITVSERIMDTDNASWIQTNIYRD